MKSLAEVCQSVGWMGSTILFRPAIVYYNRAIAVIFRKALSFALDAYWGASIYRERVCPKDSVAPV